MSLNLLAAEPWDKGETSPRAETVMSLLSQMSQACPPLLEIYGREGKLHGLGVIPGPRNVWLFYSKWDHAQQSSIQASPP